MNLKIQKKVARVKRIFLFGLLVCSLSGFVLISRSSRADEGTVNKAQDKMGDAKTTTKKVVRKTKRKVRKATGNDTVLKDAKDKASDAGDDISNEADKLKRKSQSN